MPTTNPALIPIGSVIPSAMPAMAPNPTTHRPMVRIGCDMYGDAMTTIAVATANRTAR